MVFTIVSCQFSPAQFGHGNELGRDYTKNFAEQFDYISSPVYRGGGDSDTLSGEMGRSNQQTNTGKVCYPDCPSDWEVDPYDLWQLNFDLVSLLNVEVDIGGGWLDDDGTDALLEYCIDMLCYDDTSGLADGSRVYVPKTVNPEFIRISPNPSDGHDNVDYSIRVSIEIEDETQDDTTRDSLIDLYTKERNFVVAGAVCSVQGQCHSSSEDPFDMFVVSLWPGDILSLEFNSYKFPHRGQMVVRLSTTSAGVLDTVQFWDDDSWTFWLEPDGGVKTYYISVFTLNGESYDDMTYDIDATLLWVSQNRDPLPDFDGDGWTDHDELLCGTIYTNRFSVPSDFDDDKVCDILDEDDDGDGTPDSEDEFPLDWWENADFDGDGVGDNSDTDDDDDYWLDIDEIACGTDPMNPLYYPSDHDFDGECNVLDWDDDNDFYSDVHELWECDVGAYSSFSDPLDSASTPDDIDGDFQCDALDSNRDNDNYINSEDDFPDDASEWLDTDDDGIGDNTDIDDDDDGFLDFIEADCQSDSLIFEDIPEDTDSDGVCNPIDMDDDNDGTPDESDPFPLDSREDTDTDGDGIGDNADLDDDGDGVLDSSDMFPLDSDHWADYDGDGIPDEHDSDYGGNGYLDATENLVNWVLVLMACLHAVISIIGGRRSNGK